jgi:hypothetical protein
LKWIQASVHLKGAAAELCLHCYQLILRPPSQLFQAGPSGFPALGCCLPRPLGLKPGNLQVDGLLNDKVVGPLHGIQNGVHVLNDILLLPNLALQNSQLLPEPDVFFSNLCGLIVGINPKPEAFEWLYFLDAFLLELGLAPG